MYPPEPGGPGTYAKILYDGFLELGILVEVINFEDVRRFPKGVSHLIYFFKLMRIAGSCDVLYALDPVSVGLPALIAARLRGKHFFLKVVGDYAWEQSVQRFGVTHMLDTFVKRTEGYPPLVLWLKWIESFVAKGAKQIVVPSNYLKTIVEAWGVRTDKIVVIPNAYDGVEVTARREVLRDMLKFKGTLMMSAGRLVPWKGFAGLIKLVPNLKKQFPDLKLLIAGSGPDYEKLERLAEELGIAEDVILTGSLERDVLSRYIKVADVFTLNTSYEGFSHQLLEVMAVGTPLVTTRVGGNPELVEHEKNGLLVKRGNAKELETALLRVLHDKALATRLAQNGRKRIREFGKERMVKDTIKVFKK